MHKARHGQGKHRTVGPGEEEAWFKKQKQKNRKKEKRARQARKKNRR